MIYVSPTDGHTYTGATARDVLAAMQERSHDLTLSLDDYIAEVARRSEMLHGRPFRTDAGGLLADMVAAGIVEPVGHS